jgi:hypothetical protein
MGFCYFTFWVCGPTVSSGEGNFVLLPGIAHRFLDHIGRTLISTPTHIFWLSFKSCRTIILPIIEFAPAKLKVNLPSPVSPAS